MLIYYLLRWLVHWLQARRACVAVPFAPGGDLGRIGVLCVHEVWPVHTYTRLYIQIYMYIQILTVV
jgi:hypothetical protein